VASDFYAGLIKIAKGAGVLTFLDTSGEALRKGVEAGPFFVKPNESEARVLLGLHPGEPFDSPQGAAEISKKYETNVLLSVGAEGAVVAKGQETFIVKNPTVEAKSAVGSGDCTLAGLAYGILHRLSFEESIICGVAAGTANTLTIGAGQFKIADFERLRGQVHILTR
jgi:fructose-1-phosphate kinase PfkB-like protein